MEEKNTRFLMKELDYEGRETAVNSCHESRIRHYQLHSDEVALGKLPLHE